MAASNNFSRLSTLLLVAAMVSANAGYADDKKYTVSQKTYKVLEQSRKLMDQADYRAALAKLNELLPKIADNRYETALLHQHLAYVYLEQGNYQKGLIALENTLRHADTLPPDTVQNLRYNLAQAAAQTGQYAKAQQALDSWFGEEKKPSADAWYLRGLVQYKLKHLNRAADYLRRAIILAHHENWSVLLLSIYLEQKNYRQAAGILQKLVNYYPGKKEYWMNLTDVYLMREEYGLALTTLELARHRVEFDEREILKLARLYLNKNIPYSAAQLLDKAIKLGGIRSTASNLELLANSWAAARQPEQELHYLKQAAQLRNDGNLYHRCAQLLLRKERWREAVKMLDSALAKGLKSPGQSYLLKGIAAYQAGQMNVAESAFKQAGKYKKIKSQAQQWLSQIKSSKTAS
ncbi:MAG: tetratricopeptide repeat protein [Gammaproteobacteria bacterium]